MKRLSLLVFAVLASVNAYGLDCLPFYTGSKNAEIVWQKKCDVITEDEGPVRITNATACLTELIKAYPKAQKTIALSVEMTRDGRSYREVIINYVNNAVIDGDKIVFDQETASPELMRRYRTQVQYDKSTDELTIKKAEGTFSLSTKFNFKMSCR
ncbi:MAG: hypothetical protein WC635_15540 [Bacteriovorax sp.]|jgi:hypothetical protein